MSNFDICIVHVLASEGGYVNDPKDAGGETNFGISKRFCDQHKNDPLCLIPLKELTKELASKIYKKYFWDSVKIDLINDVRLAFKLFDFGVNAGSGTSVQLLQKTYNKNFQPGYIAADGLLGDKSADAINGIDAKTLVNLFIDEIIYHYKQIVLKNPSQSRFINGWTTRARRLPEF